MGRPTDQLVDENAKYNAEARKSGRQPRVKGPFHALGPVKSYIILIDGGLTVNRDHQVTRKDGSVVDGLYAVGSAGQGGLLLEGHGHHLAWAFTSGRLVAKHAVRGR